MGSIDQNLRSCAGVEKEKQCGILLTASERQNKGLVWLIDGSPNEHLSDAESLTRRAVAHGKRGVEAASLGDDLTSSQGDSV